ncbi:ABC transporter substrate-binding protein [Oceanivirga miroungae]|uniref:Family 1 extracellular solute-binding protein n=1 Tax=Oceanivirga miroungae TaxID=1130046 RepID=A0A6I8M6N8_9FUSO|nr:ABC transporter substrate-binding protein [Oceanivirga miroungae]VWL85126.1 family 1 extracellular solute-binding protein [Oceanivirga miroungae]
MKNKLFKFMSVAALTVAVIACGNKEEKANNQEAKANEVVTIKYWGFPNFNADSEFKDSEEFDHALIKAFEEKNPNIKIEYQKIDFTDGPAKLNTAIQANSAPDVVFDAPGRIIAWAKDGYLVPFNNVDKSQFADSLVTASSVDGKLYLRPLGSQPFLMAFNKKITDKLGVTDMLPLNKPGRNWTVKEFEALLTKIHKKDASIDPVLFYTKSQAGDQGPRAFVSNIGNAWITNNEVTEYAINTPSAIKGLTWLKSAYDKGLIGKSVSAEAKDALEAFATGKAAGTILYSAGLKALAAHQKAIADGVIEPVFVAFPNDSGQAKFEFLLAGAAVFDNNDEKRAKAAQEFVEFVTTDPVWGPRALKATKNFSPVKGVTGTYGNDPEVKYLESLSSFYGPYYNIIDGFPQMRPLWFNMVQGVLNGQITPADGLNGFVKDANATIKDAK